MNVSMLSIFLVSFFSMLTGMDHRKTQYEICDRRAYIANVKQQRQDIAEKKIVPVCSFCDLTILAANHIISEDPNADVREMVNQNPYLKRNRGFHLLIMPISHITNFAQYSREQVQAQAYATQRLSRKFHHVAYSQESFFNNEPGGGSSVEHVHGHLKVYTQPPVSMREQIKIDSSSSIPSAEETFSVVKEILASDDNNGDQFHEAEAMQENSAQCLCCSIFAQEESDDDNWVFFRGKHNIICVAPNPSLPGEIAVLPKKHVSSIKDLSLEEYEENLLLAMALLPFVKKYTGENIRECIGGNLFTNNIGGKASIKKQQKHHVHTCVMPRANIVLSPGTVYGTSCKIDLNPVHFFEYLKSKRDELLPLIQ